MVRLVLQVFVYVLMENFACIKRKLTEFGIFAEEKSHKKYKNSLTYQISMLLYNHTEKTYKTNMNTKHGGNAHEYKKYK